MTPLDARLAAIQKRADAATKTMGAYSMAESIADTHVLLRVIAKLRDQRDRHPQDCIGRRIKLDAELLAELTRKDT